MNEKEKAKELAYRMKYSDGRFSSNINVNAKQCALICVDEMIKMVEMEIQTLKAMGTYDNTIDYFKYVQGVKTEINKL